MVLKSKNQWIKAIALLLASPVFAIPSLFIIAIIASAIPPPESVDVWLDSSPFKRSVGVAVFTAILSVDSMLRAFYISLPLLLAGAFVLLSLNIGIRTVQSRISLAALCMGLLYVVLFYGGVYAGWLEEPSWT